MTTEVRTFQAASMQEALELVRRELGQEAVILHTRQMEKRRLLPWQRPIPVVEITAGLGVNVRPVARVANRTEAVTAAPVSTPRAARTPRTQDELLAPPPDLMPKPSRPTQRVSVDTLPPNASVSTRKPCENKSGVLPTVARPAPHRRDAGATGAGAVEKDLTTEFARKLDTIQRMLENLGPAGRQVGNHEIPSELFQLYTDLIDAEVEEELARELIFRLKDNATPNQLHDNAAAKALLTAVVEKDLRCAPPITATRGRRKVVALIGPTGVGKTTTIAKLAANFRLRDGVKLGLVTVDTYRVAAVEQLRTYAEIIDLPMKVVTSPQEMRRALEELSGLDLVLIDTAGRSPRDELKIQELKTLLAEARVDEIHLVLSLVASVRTLHATAEKFAAVSPTSLILTKLDEASGSGTLLSVARKIALPISYLTTGQDVPDDIEPAHAGRLARLVLGQEKLTV